MPHTGGRHRVLGSASACRQPREIKAELWLLGLLAPRVATYPGAARRAMNECLLLDQDLKDFAAQDRMHTLILSCRAGDLVVPSKLFMAQAQQSEAPIFLGVGLCPSAGQWVDQLVGSVQADLNAANATRAQADLAPSLGMLPLDVMDTRLAPPARMEGMVRHLGSLVDYAQTLVWVLLPVNCEDLEGYRDAVRGFLQREDWMEGHRFVLWDDAEQPQLVPEALAQGAQHCVVRDIDFSPPTQLDALAARAAHPRSTPSERKDAMFQLAVVDYAYERYDESLKKYRWVFSQCAQEETGTLAMCLQGAGDIAMRREDPQAALEYFQSALGTALAVKTPPSAVIQPILMGAGEASLLLGKFSDAENYFEYGNLVAAKNLNAFAKADAIERRGVAQEAAARAGAQEKGQEALASYALCKQVSCAFGYAERWQEVSAREIAWLEHSGQSDAAREVSTQLEAGFEAAAQRHLATQKEGRPSA